MEFLKNPKFKISIRLGSILISLLEILFLRILYLNYGNSINYGYFIPLILAQPLWYFNITSVNKRTQSSCHFKYSSIILLLISFLIIISFPMALPKYTYNQGKKLLREEYISESSSIVYDNNVSTLQVSNFTKKFPKNLFMSDKFYYYELDIDNSKRSFMLNPINGDVLELKEGFFN